MKKLILLVFLLSACSGINVTAKNDTTLCPAPKKPKYQQLDNATHIGGDKNIIFLMNDLNMMKLYMEQMNATIWCYEQQVPKKEEKK